MLESHTIGTLKDVSTVFHTEITVGVPLVGPVIVTALPKGREMENDLCKNTQQFPNPARVSQPSHKTAQRKRGRN